jgi:hypothetical protein
VKERLESNMRLQEFHHNLNDSSKELIEQATNDGSSDIPSKNWSGKGKTAAKDSSSKQLKESVLSKFKGSFSNQSNPNSNKGTKELPHPTSTKSSHRNLSKFKS